jgi:hypothetical protein
VFVFTTETVGLVVANLAPTAVITMRIRAVGDGEYFVIRDDIHRLLFDYFGLRILYGQGKWTHAKIFMRSDLDENDSFNITER